MRKMVKLTNKATNESLFMLISSVGEHVFKMTNDVNVMNHAISWCNRHNIGETCDYDDFSIELMEEKPVQ